MLRRYLARRKMRWAVGIVRRDSGLFTCGACIRNIPPRFHERHHRWHTRVLWVQRIRRYLTA